MEQYTGFAEVYDTFMDQVPYEEWARFICGTLKKYQIENGLLADLGCGTGNLTRILSRAGYEMIGIDASEEMLAVARGKMAEGERDILYLQQDMRQFELYGTVRAVVCVCDSLNYLLGEEDIKRVFSLVNNYLDPGGVFLFDFHTPVYYERELGSQIFAEDRERCSYIWNNVYDRAQAINEYDLTLFVEEQSQKPDRHLYRRYQETHVQRGYTLPQMRRLLEEAGLQFLSAHDDYAEQPAGGGSHRTVVIAREQRKEQGNSRGLEEE